MFAYLDISKKSERGAVLRREGAPFSSLREDRLAELTVVAARLVPPLVACGAVAHTRATLDFDLCVLGVLGRAPGLTGEREVELFPVPARRTVVTERLEELPGHAALHRLVADLSAVQVLSDDVKGTGFVPGVGDPDALSRLTGQPYHLLM